MDIADETYRWARELFLLSLEEWSKLAAITDRLFLRRTVQPIRSRVGREKLLWTADHTRPEPGAGEQRIHRLYDAYFLSILSHLYRFFASSYASASP